MTAQTTGFRGVIRRLMSQKSAALSLIVLLLFLGMAIFSEGYAAYCRSAGKEPVYTLRDEAHKSAAPSAEHWLGTDYLGRDILTRAVFAVRTSVKVGLAASVIAVAVGVSLGICAGYFGGKTDDAVTWVHSTFASIPSLLFILALALLVSKGYLPPAVDSAVKTCARCIGAEPGMFAVYVAIGLTSWVSLCRVIRAEAMRLRGTGYVLAAKALGEPPFAILRKHVLPNLTHLIIVYFTMLFAQAVMSEVIISYLGLGVQFEPSWGIMISQGQNQLWLGKWWEVGTATAFLFVLVLALNTLGDALRDALDPRLL